MIRRSHRATPPRAEARRLRQLSTSVGATFGLVVVCLMLGLLVARGHRVAEIVIGITAAFALVTLGSRIKFTAVVFWVGANGIAYDFIRYPTQHAVVTFDRIWVLAMLGWLVTERKRFPTSRPSRAVVISGLCLVAAFGLRALFTSGEVKNALETWFDAGVLPLILFIAARRGAVEGHNLDRLGAAFAICGAAIGTLGIAQRLIGFNLASRLGTGLTIGQDVGLRVSSPYPTDDILAVALLMCLAGTLFWIQRDQVNRLSPGFVILALELGGIYFTFFRGAYIGVLLIAIAALGLRPRRFARLFGATVVVAALAYFAYGQLTHNSGVSQRLNNQQNVSGRLATYQEGWQIFKGHPLAGVGVGQFAEAEANILSISVNGVTGVDTAHSSYIDALAETGLLGFLPLVALTLSVIYLVYSLLRAPQNPRDTLFAAALTGALLAFLLMSAEETTILLSTDNLFLAVLLGAATARMDVLHASQASEPPAAVPARRPFDLPLPLNGSGNGHAPPLAAPYPGPPGRPA